MDLYNLNLSIDELVKILDKKFPAQCVRPGMTLAEASYEAGQRSVVDLLIQARDNPEDI